jgi:ubiquitin-like 1-activating enzyme E1 B
LSTKTVRSHPHSPLPDAITPRANAPVLPTHTHSELLKNLVLSGFTDLEVIDLDTIDVSNLNRQFLFRKKDVGAPKSLVAKDSVLRFNPNAGIQITSHLGNVKDPALFNADFVRGFSCVANALDNISARKHVNQICAAAQVPLMEAGSTGYEGQTNVHLGHVCECYQCLPKAAPKKHPICTIRSTPSKPVHCIEWAKHLFCLLFGNPEDSMLAGGGGADEDAAAVAAEAGEGAAATGADAGAAAPAGAAGEKEEADSAATDYLARDARIQASYARPDCTDPAALDGAALRAYGERVFGAWFDAEIQNKMTKKVYKTATHTPTPVRLSAIGGDIAAVGNPTAELMGGGGSVLHSRVWTVAESAAVFFECVRQAYATEDYRNNIGTIPFDKDDKLALDFVTAASNLRSHVFGIPMQSPFSVKQIAGNIVHAIATTNAIIAGLETLEVMKVCADPNNHLIRAAKRREMEARQGSSALSADDIADRVAAMKAESDAYIMAKCKATFIYLTPNRRGMVLGGGRLCKPKESCDACRNALATVTLDTNKCTLQTFVDVALKGKLGFVEPSFLCGNDAEKIFDYPDDYYDAPQGEEAMGATVVSQLPGSGGLYPGAVVLVREEENPEIEANVVVRHKDAAEFDAGKFPEMVQVEFTEAQRQRRADNGPKTLARKKREAEAKAAEEEKKKKKAEAVAAGGGGGGGGGSGDGKVIRGFVDDDGVMEIEDDDEIMILEEDDDCEEGKSNGAAAVAAESSSRKRDFESGMAADGTPAFKRARTPE